MQKREQKDLNWITIIIELVTQTILAVEQLLTHCF